MVHGEAGEIGSLPPQLLNDARVEPLQAALNERAPVPVRLATGSDDAVVRGPQ
ncbi:hypothetical protein AAGW05_06030 [Arthrobacter sp. LAPM80]|uniref:hypothetical protein n=1 Tax=Arthrobacter sp. LAPM80 TaxID=3141788 RepID=UPI00398AAF0A